MCSSALEHLTQRTIIESTRGWWPSTGVSTQLPFGKPASQWATDWRAGSTTERQTGSNNYLSPQLTISEKKKFRKKTKKEEKIKKKLQKEEEKKKAEAEKAKQKADREASTKSKAKKGYLGKVLKHKEIDRISGTIKKLRIPLSNFEHFRKRRIQFTWWWER